MNRVTQEIRLALGALLVVQLINTLGSLAVLGRMSPMIERILGDNVSTIEDSEGMLVQLTATATSTLQREHFDNALEDAKSHITMSEERPLVEMIELMYVDALAPDAAESRARTVAAITDLSSLNRQAMGEANIQAKQLAASGAWASVLLGLTGLLISAVFARRLSNQIAAPLGQLRSVVDAAIHGDSYRRFRAEGSPEVLEIGRGVNRLLDERLEPIHRRSMAEIDRSAVLHLLDQAGRLAVVIDHEGKVLVSSQAALPLLEGEAGDTTRHALVSFIRDQVVLPPIGAIHELIQGEAWMIELKGAEAATPAPPA